MTKPNIWKCYSGAWWYCGGRLKVARGETPGAAYEGWAAKIAAKAGEDGR